MPDPVIPVLQSGGSAVGSGPSDSLPPRQLTLKLNVQKAALLLSLLGSLGDSGSAVTAASSTSAAVEPAPLLELAASSMTGKHMRGGCGSTEGWRRSIPISLGLGL